MTFKRCDDYSSRGATSVNCTIGAPHSAAAHNGNGGNGGPGGSQGPGPRGTEKIVFLAVLGAGKHSSGFPEAVATS